MENMIEDTTNSKLFPANEPADHELYTIPTSSSWFSWNDIHETEKLAFNEFFNSTSISKTPKIYKEYRDFIINKYREDPKRRITFTEIRKSLIGDVSLICKVFSLLEKWGLIHFGAPAVPDSLTVVGEDEEKVKVVVEEGAPTGVRVVAFPNSSVPVTLLRGGGDGEGMENVGFKLPPLTSYSDVFGDLAERRKLSCTKCGGVWEIDKKETIATCSRCLKNEKNEDSNAVNDLNLKDSKDNSDYHGAASWTDAETSLLLESVLLHGHDWDLVAQYVRTKRKSECIAKLIQLPFGELMLTGKNGNGDGRNSINKSINITEDQSTSVEPRKPIEKEDLLQKQINESKNTENCETEEPPQKRRCIDSFANASDSLMKQVAHLSTMVSPYVAAAAVDAAITALCEENPYARMFIEGDEDINANEPKRLLNAEHSEMVENHTLSDTHEDITEKNSTSVTLRIRTAIATAFGGAAAHAKLLADQEDREIEHLVGTVIDTQLKKIQNKIKHFEELELIMEKEYAQMQELKEAIIADRIDVLQKVFNAGIPRWTDYSSLKPIAGNVV